MYMTPFTAVFQYHCDFASPKSGPGIWGVDCSNDIPVVALDSHSIVSESLLSIWVNYSSDSDYH